MYKREVIVGIACLVLGILITTVFGKKELSSNRILTTRILSNAIDSMEISQNLAESCSEAYNTATACVSNLSECNIKNEAQKLDEYNIRRKNSDEHIKLINKDMEEIIKEVSTNR